MHCTKATPLGQHSPLACHTLGRFLGKCQRTAIERYVVYYSDAPAGGSRIPGPLPTKAQGAGGLPGVPSYLTSAVEMFQPGSLASSPPKPAPSPHLTSLPYAGMQPWTSLWRGAGRGLASGKLYQTWGATRTSRLGEPRPSPVSGAHTLCSRSLGGLCPCCVALGNGAVSVGFSHLHTGSQDPSWGREAHRC